MKYKQLVKFNLAKMGTTWGFSLKNVRLGFGVPARHASAYRAMVENKLKHTLHDLSTIPKDCSVPVYCCEPGTHRVGNVLVYHKGRYYQDGKKLWRKPRGSYRWGEWLNGVRIVKEKNDSSSH